MILPLRDLTVPEIITGDQSGSPFGAIMRMLIVITASGELERPPMCFSGFQ